MAGKKKKLCTSFTKFSIVNNRPTNIKPVGNIADSVIVIGGHRYACSEQCACKIETATGSEQTSNTACSCEII